MVMNEIAPCGIDCSNCELYEARGLREVWERVGQRLGRKAEEMACKGCRAGGGCVLHEDCATLACVKERRVDYCSDCGQFPCVRLQPLAEGAGVYPHNLKVYNLMRIRQVGPERFLEEAPRTRFLYYKGKMLIGSGPQDPGR